ncbi:MAG: LCP family protein [Thermoleophilia bacterium]
MDAHNEIPDDSDSDSAVQAERRWVRWAQISAFIMLVVAAVALSVLCGRTALGNVYSVVRLVVSRGSLPDWLMWVGPAAALAAAAGSVLYLACGRRRLIKVGLVLVTAAALALPGAAVGWASATAATLSAKTSSIQATVAEARAELQPSLTGDAVNILVLGSDYAEAGSNGRSDTIIILRLDPDTGTVAMLSLPRDLRTYIPGVGVDKLNAAYAYGGVPLTIKTVKRLTGLSIHHFVQIDFDGFWQTVDILGGVYLSIDRRYYVPESASYKSIDLQPGYQLVGAKQALNFVRSRHDEGGDFTRMLRQQLFLREVQRQAERWSTDWQRVIRLTKAICTHTSTDLDTLDQILPIVGFVSDLDTGDVTSVRVTGSTPTIDGVSYVVATQAKVDDAVDAFLAPSRAAKAAEETDEAVEESSEASTSETAAPPSASAARTAASYAEAADATTQKVDLSSWSALAEKTPLELEAPTVWASGLAYDQFRAYAIRTTEGRRVAAAVVVGTYGSGSWSIQALRWTDPPAIAHPSAVRVVDGRRYMLFKQSGHLHMIAWKENGVLYWVLNTLDDQLPNDLMLALATSCQPLTK